MKNLIVSPWSFIERQDSALQDPSTFGKSYGLNKELFLCVDNVYVNGKVLDLKNISNFIKLKNDKLFEPDFIKRILHSNFKLKMKEKTSDVDYILNPEWESAKQEKDFKKNLEWAAFYMIESSHSRTTAPNWYGHIRLIENLSCAKVDVKIE